MGIRTRGVSLSLESLGISVPRSHSSSAASRSHRSPSNSHNNASNNPPNNADHPPPKRVKRSHTQSSSTSSASPSPAPPAAAPRTASSAGAAPLATATTEATPPPSPGSQRSRKVDTQGIKDDIVVAVIEQLQSTGNRPHLIKELATILANSLKAVESSSNPQAIISSRLTNYLRRPWTALAPCPLAKEQVAVHPRRVYFYLTTCPRQEIPEVSDVPETANGTRVVSPSISSGTEDDADMSVDGHGPPTTERRRQSLSPSPELDLTSHELELTQVAPSFANVSDSHDYGNSRVRAESPALEHDEREFSQTANFLQARKLSDLSEPPITESSVVDDDLYNYSYSFSEEHDDTPTNRASHEAAAAALFGGGALLGVHPQHESAMFSSPLMRPISSPMMKPKDLSVVSVSTPTRKGFDFSWSLGDVRSPEAVGLNELDDMLGGF